MAENYQVRQGECISSIAFEKGFFPDTIWDHPNNKELKARRKDPNILMPGDVVHVPDKRLKELSESTNQVYKYRVKNVPAKLSIRILFDGEPRRNEPFVLDVNGQIKHGSTDSDGNLTAFIPPNAKAGKLTVGTGERYMEYQLELGRLDPSSEISGAQKRLNNLGFQCGQAHGQLNEDTKKALQAFQAFSGITVTGELDEATKGKLRHEHERI